MQTLTVILPELQNPWSSVNKLNKSAVTNTANLPLLEELFLHMQGFALSFHGKGVLFCMLCKNVSVIIQFGGQQITEGLH